MAATRNFNSNSLLSSLVLGPLGYLILILDLPKINQRGIKEFIVLKENMYLKFYEL